MKVTLCIDKDGAILYEGAHDVFDAASFGNACARAWSQLREQRMAHATSVGALFEALDEHLLDDLDGAKISVSKVR